MAPLHKNNDRLDPRGLGAHQPPLHNGAQTSLPRCRGEAMETSQNCLFRTLVSLDFSLWC